MLSGIASSAAVLIAYFQLSKLSRQMSETHEWNRRKTSHEVLDVLVFGEFPALRTTIESALACKIPDKEETYDKKMASLSDEDKETLDKALRQLLNILESIAINIKHNIIDEDICYDYLGWIMVEYHRWSLAFIDTCRNRAGDSRVLAGFSECAEKWAIRIATEKRRMATVSIVSPKQAL